jgi:riboflavin synthase
VFTGIVEEVGTVTRVDLESGLDSLRVRGQAVVEGTALGDSIAVNGTCLTVTALLNGELVLGVMPETLRRTNLGDLGPGDGVNLERPVQPQTRLGGHFVQGHVDGVGTVESVEPDGTSLLVSIAAPPEILRYVVEKGFIAVDGASLTVTGVDERAFSIALIEYTQTHVAPTLFTPGKRVNLEVDILAKYVEKLVVH